MISFKVRLKEALEKTGMKQADLVRKTNITKGTISGYLTGKYKPKQKNIYKLADALNVNIDWLMGFEDVDIKIMQQPLYLKKITLLLSDLSESERKKLYEIMLIIFDRNDILQFTKNE